jgi:hypothetical protein
MSHDGGEPETMEEAFGGQISEISRKYSFLEKRTLS